jgi:signal transduction histidine kinase
MTGREGKLYVRKNPAMVTKELSHYAQKEGLYSFHITSLLLMNPENAPDDFERKALREFDAKKATDASRMEKIGGADFFRYMEPLYVEEACLECHLTQGYKVGDIRGAISITIPMEYTLSVIASDRKYMALGGGLAVMLLMIVLFMITRNMVINPINRIRAHMLDFSKQGKADVSVLKTGDEIEDLSRSFIDMARSIEDYHSCLQEKITAATRELIEKNETLDRLNKTKSGFIAKISHELRTPLTSIKGAMDYLSTRLSMQGKGEEDDLSVFFDVIKKNAERLIRLVNNVLDYERIGLGAFEMHFYEVNLRDIFDEVITGFRSEAYQKKVNIRLEAEDVRVYADEDRIKQVMVNLLSNALNFSPESSEIVVSLSAKDDHALVSVTDSGGGIPESERDQIFNQFYTRGVKNGTGLGLTICRGIIEAHGGRIDVSSEAGKGSTFYFRIPVERGRMDGEEKEAACH